MNSKDLYQIGMELFTKRTRLLTLWQDIALNFYPARADFTWKREIGSELAVGMTTSYPYMVCRDLANTIGTMLRPTAKPWFHMGTGDDLSGDIEARRWLEWAEGTMRRAMYDKDTMFTRATKEGDCDFAAFGQCAISVELNRNADTLLYRSWHLRDMAWQEGTTGSVDQVFRKWKPGARNLTRMFKNVDPKVLEAAQKQPFREIECCHMVVPADMYDGNFKTKFVSIYYDVENDFEMEKVGVHNPIYTIPRWQTVSGSQYANSPATMVALPDGRLLQSMTLTLLEAGEKHTNPPMIAVQEAIRSDISVYAGGVTWVDAAYDERLGEVLRPLNQDKSGMPLGVEMQRDTRAMLKEAFFLNKLTMPDRGKAEMTAFEVGQRVEEYIRQALPIFEPMEAEYNGGLCDLTFDVLQRAGAFGGPDMMPRSLRGSNVEFKFTSPLHDMIDAQMAHKFLQAQQLSAAAIAMDQSSGIVLDVKEALRGALYGAGIPAKWQRSEEEVDAIMAKEAQQAQAEALLGTLQAGADVAKTLGEASATMPSQAAA